MEYIPPPSFNAPTTVVTQSQSQIQSQIQSQPQTKQDIPPPSTPPFVAQTRQQHASPSPRLVPQTTQSIQTPSPALATPSPTVALPHPPPTTRVPTLASLPQSQSLSFTSLVSPRFERSSNIIVSPRNIAGSHSMGSPHTINNPPTTSIPLSQQNASPSILSPRFSNTNANTNSTIPPLLSPKGTTLSSPREKDKFSTLPSPQQSASPLSLESAKLTGATLSQKIGPVLNKMMMGTGTLRRKPSSPEKRVSVVNVFEEKEKQGSFLAQSSFSTQAVPANSIFFFTNHLAIKIT